MNISPANRWVAHLAFVLVAYCAMAAPESAAQPRVAVSGLKIELFAALDPVSPGLIDPMDPKGPGQQYAFYDLALSTGQNGFPPRLYASTGPFPRERGNRIFRIDSAGHVTVFRTGFNSSQQLVFTRGPYKALGGMLVSEPLTGRIRAVDPTKFPMATVATVTRNVIPRGLTFGRDVFPNRPDAKEEVLYVEGETRDAPNRARILRVPAPPRVAAMSVVADFEVPKLPPAPRGQAGGMSCGKAAAFDDAGTFAQGVPGLIVSTFTITSVNLTDAPPPNLDRIYSITPSPAGPVTRTLASGLNGVMYIKLGPGDEVFGSDLYVPTLGTPSRAQNGSVLRLNPEGKLTTFIENIKATSIAFDIEGVLGVKRAMYVSEFTPYEPGRIWRVTPMTPGQQK
jgi:hypothetical protein